MDNPKPVMRVKFFIFSIIIMIGVVLIAWFVRDVYRSDQVKNILLISIDTCRADYLSCYGYPRKTTPNIDAVGEQGVLFENVTTPYPMTLPAHSSMLTGTIPPYHGVHKNLGYILNDSNITLAEILNDNGFTTAAVIGSFVLDSKFGLDQGFETYDDSFDEDRVSMGFAERRAEEVTRHAGLWLQEYPDKPFFLFLHYYDPHLAYDPPEPFKSTFADNLYAGEIAYVDYYIGEIIKKLKSLDLYDSTLIIVTSDHGEGLKQHGEVIHGYFIYQSTVRVPMVIKVPGGLKNKRIKDDVGLIDIVPTVCSMLGIVHPESVRGHDLSGYLLNDDYSAKNDRNFYCETLLPMEYNCNPLIGVISNRYKYIQTTRPELYDLSTDPGELNDLIDRQPQRARIMQDKIKQILDRQLRSDADKSRTTTDEETRKRLESLGYISGRTIEDSFEFDPTKNDPKDLLDFYLLNCRAIAFLTDKNSSEFIEICNEMLKIDPDFANTYKYLGTFYFGREDYEKSAYYYSKYLELEPDQHTGHKDLGMAYLRLDRFEEALKSFNEAIRIKPDYMEPYANIGTILMNLNKPGQAAGYFRKALELAPDDTDITDDSKEQIYKTHFNLARIYFKQNKPGLAVEHYLEALRINPDFTEAHYNLGVLYSAQGRYEQAITHFQKTYQLIPEDNTEEDYRVKKKLAYLARANLAQIFQVLGRQDLMVRHLEGALEIDPDQYSVHDELAILYYNQAKLSQAIKHWIDVIELRPDNVKALNALAWVKATSADDKFRDPQEALELARRASELADYNQPLALDTLAAALAANGKFTEAVQTAQKAMTLLDTLKDQDRILAKQIKERIKLYKTDQPYIQTTGPGDLP